MGFLAALSIQIYGLSKDVYRDSRWAARRQMNDEDGRRLLVLSSEVGLAAYGKPVSMLQLPRNGEVEAQALYLAHHSPDYIYFFPGHENTWAPAYAALREAILQGVDGQSWERIWSEDRAEVWRRLEPGLPQSSDSESSEPAAIPI